MISLSLCLIPIVWAHTDDNFQSESAIIDLAIDICQCIDIILNFFTAEKDKLTGFYQTKPKKMIGLYIKSYFFFDLFSLIPFFTQGKLD